MKTIGGHEIKNFIKLKRPKKRYFGDFIEIYSGFLINDKTFKRQRCAWDINGHVINRSVPRYDIDLKIISENE